MPSKIAQVAALALAGLLAFVPARAVAAAAAEIEIVAASIPPYVYEDGKATRGVVAELVQAMAKRRGHSGRINFYPWKRALQLARTPTDGKPRLIIPLNRSPERENAFTWVAPLVTDETVIVTNVGYKATVSTAGEGLGYRIGVLSGSPLEVQLQNLGFKRIEPGNDEAENARKLGHGRLDAWFVATMVAPFVFKQQGFDPRMLRYGLRLDLNDLHLGATKSLPEAEARAWRDAFEAIKADGTLTRIVESYRPQ